MVIFQGYKNIMIYKFLTDIDLNKNYLRKARFENLAEAPENPAESQIYYNTTDKSYYFYQIVDNVGEWVGFVNTKQLIEELNKKQDVLTAGEGISIEENQQGDTVISVTNFNTIYEKTFSTSDFINGTMTILASEHNCGTSPVLDTIMMLNNNMYYNVGVCYSHNLSGDVYIEVNNAFNGFLRISSPHHDAAETETTLNNILYGTV